MNDERPNPDELLARVQADEAATRRGKLKIFFGYVAGVGKTYAMLEAARRAKADGVDVVVGYVEPHKRPETEALLTGLEVIPPLEVPYRGVTLRELNLDAALQRRPQLVLVDELAHTNAEGLRHAKRWQDVEELLNAGIDVFTTLNVQHLESLNDVIAQITGVVVRETLPDSVLERADDIELIDLTPEELIERLEEGKVYIAPQAERALKSFFQKSNLVTLRELSLREAAQRLRRDVEAARAVKAPKTPWATAERLLVCVGPSPTTAKLIRTARRMAAAFDADWLAVAVEPPHSSSASPTAREQVAQHLRLAERLGAETHILTGPNVADTILDYARSRNVTKIVVGKTAQSWWRRLMGQAVVDTLLSKSGEIDVYVIRGEGAAATSRPVHVGTPSISLRGYVAAVAVMLACGLLGWLCHQLGLAEVNIVMVFLIGVVVVASALGRGPAVFAAIAGVVVFDFFFVSPYLSFAVSDTQYVFTFAVMLAVGLLISTLTARLQKQLQASRYQEQRTAALFRLTRQMSEVSGVEFLIGSAGKQLAEIFDGEALVYVRDDSMNVTLRYGHQSAAARHAVNPLVAQWVADHDQNAGFGTDTLPNASAYFVPLTGSQRTMGAVGIQPNNRERFADPEQRRLLETCASLIALSIERDQSMLAAEEARRTQATK